MTSGNSGVLVSDGDGNGADGAVWQLLDPSGHAGRSPNPLVVVGSLNLDTVSFLPKLPAPGETVLAIDYFTGAGGKGANQAAAAAKLGLAVTMVGRIGDDDIGRYLVAALTADGVDVQSVLRTPGAVTGQAHIAVAPNGENMIVVNPGANALLTPNDIEGAATLLASTEATLLQLEIPVAAVTTAAALSGGIVVLNPAPAQPIKNGLLELVDVLVPNRAELMTIAGASTTNRDVEKAALGMKLPCALVVTLGADGALIVKNGRTSHVAAPKVAAIDTTGAGDAFCAALTAGLMRGKTLEEATHWAVHVASWTTTRRGARASRPTSAETSEVAFLP
jgi:ribokinase